MAVAEIVEKAEIRGRGLWKIVVERAVDGKVWIKILAADEERPGEPREIHGARIVVTNGYVELDEEVVLERW